MPLAGKVALTATVNTLAKLTRAAVGSDKRYHPEQHYMRGRGLKYREKHLLGRARGA
jgi:hypothetical protein